MDRYTELYAWMWKSFGGREFTIDEFRMVFPTSQATKVIHDLVGKGYIYRVRRGTYRLTEPGHFVRNITTWEPDDTILDEAGKEYAFCESTAVAIWTEGYYWTGFTKGFRPIHIAVRDRDLEEWKAFLRKKKARFAVEGGSRTLYGRVYILHPRESVRSEEREGSRVVPLDEVVAFCLEREIAYEPALEYLDEKYGIGYPRREALEV
ncbi:MAG: hypothetical protein JRJ29_21315 [Deltaproteobacteria bacterium]|nr:hypothetical protein [Deltaproteobacteria bacterium]